MLEYFKIIARVLPLDKHTITFFFNLTMFV